MLIEIDHARPCEFLCVFACANSDVKCDVCFWGVLPVLCSTSIVFPLVRIPSLFLFVGVFYFCRSFSAISFSAVFIFWAFSGQRRRLAARLFLTHNLSPRACPHSCQRTSHTLKRARAPTLLTLSLVHTHAHIFNAPPHPGTSSPRPGQAILVGQALRLVLVLLGRPRAADVRRPGSPDGSAGGPAAA